MKKIFVFGFVLLLFMSGVFASSYNYTESLTQSYSFNTGVGTTINDDMGVRNIPFHANHTWITGQKGYGLGFGTNSILRITPAKISHQSQMTINVWVQVNKTDISANGAVIWGTFVHDDNHVSSCHWNDAVFTGIYLTESHINFRSSRGGVLSISENNSFYDNGYFMLTYVRNNVNATAHAYINGVNVGNIVRGGFLGSGHIYAGRTSAPTCTQRDFIGNMDTLGRWHNEVILDDDILYLYEQGFEYPYITEFNFELLIVDEQSQSIENATFTSDLYTHNSSSDGVIITDYTSPDELINFTVSYPSYYTQTFTNYNTSQSPLTVQMIPYENFSFSVKDSTTNSNIFNATVILNNVTYDNFSSFPFTTPLNDFGVYNYTVFADGYYNLTGEVNTTQFNYIFELEKIPIPLSSTCPLHVDSTERLFYMIFLLVGFVLTLLGFGMQKAVLTIFGSFFIMIVSFTLLACGSILVGILIVFSVCMLFIGATQHDV